MANRTVYFDNCIKEIRESVYGRDNRKPIADALEILKPDLESISARYSSEISDLTSQIQNKIDGIQTNMFNGANVQLISDGNYALTILTT